MTDDCPFMFVLSSLCHAPLKMLDERDLLDDALRFLPSQFSRDEVTLAMVENVALEVDTKGTSDPVGTGGSVFVTNLRILWVPATGGSGRAVQLQCVTGCKLKSLLGLNILGTTRVRVSVAVSAAGAQVPASSGSPEERKVWLAAKSGADRIHQSIIQAIRERAWERVAPERDAREGAASTSTGPSRVDSGHLKQLVSMGFPENQARDALAHLPGRPLHDIGEHFVSCSSNSLGMASGQLSAPPPLSVLFIRPLIRR